MAQPKTTTKEAFDIKKFKEESKAKHADPNRKSFGSIIISIGMLLVVLSIAYSTYRILTGTDDIVAWVMLIPQALFAAYVLVKQFTK